jgi:hypothetical protein
MRLCCSISRAVPCHSRNRVAPAWSLRVGLTITAWRAAASSAIRSSRQRGDAEAAERVLLDATRDRPNQQIAAGPAAVVRSHREPFQRSLS